MSACVLNFEKLFIFRSPTLVKNIPTSLGYGAALNASLQVKNTNKNKHLNYSFFVHFNMKYLTYFIS